MVPADEESSEFPPDGLGLGDGADLDAVLHLGPLVASSSILNNNDVAFLTHERGDHLLHVFRGQHLPLLTDDG